MNHNYMPIVQLYNYITLAKLNLRLNKVAVCSVSAVELHQSATSFKGRSLSRDQTLALSQQWLALYL